MKKRCKPVKVFITYSWDDKSHKAWAKQLANELLAKGIDATIDQYDLEPGDRIPQFMEKSINDAKYVLVICTPKYRQKANNRHGGVGYESHLIAGELFNKANEHKFIPILRRGTIKNAIPSYLSGKWAFNLSEELDQSEYDEHFLELVTKLKGEKKKPIVAIGDTKAVKKEELANATICATIEEYNESDNTFTVSLYDYDLFKANEIKGLAVGDIILVGQMSYTVKKITTTPYDGELKIIMDDHTEIIFSEGTNGNMIAYSPDDDRIFMHVYSVLRLKAASDIIYEDASDPDDMDKIIITKGIENILKIKAEKEEFGGLAFVSSATKITINDKLEIEKIHQDFDVGQ